MPTVLLLDKPAIAEKKSKPKRLTMVLIITFMGFSLSCMFFIAKPKLNEYRSKIIKSKDQKQ